MKLLGYMSSRLMYSELQGDHVAFQCLFVEGMKTKLAVKKDFCQEVFSLVSRNMAWCLALKNLFPGRQILEDTGCDAEMHHCSKAVSYFMEIWGGEMQGGESLLQELAPSWLIEEYPEPRSAACRQ